MHDPVVGIVIEEQGGAAPAAGVDAIDVVVGDGAAGGNAVAGAVDAASLGRLQSDVVHGVMGDGLIQSQRHDSMAAGVVNGVVIDGGVSGERSNAAGVGADRADVMNDIIADDAAA